MTAVSVPFLLDSGHKGSVLDLCWVGCKVLSSGSDGRVLMWTTVTAELALESQGIIYYTRDYRLSALYTIEFANKKW